jgi:hypothetical protein
VTYVTLPKTKLSVATPWPTTLYRTGRNAVRSQAAVGGWLDRRLGQNSHGANHTTRPRDNVNRGATFRYRCTELLGDLGEPLVR